MRSFRREFVRSPVPIVAVSLTIGTRPSSGLYGLVPDNIVERSTYVAPVTAWDT